MRSPVLDVGSVRFEILRAGPGPRDVPCLVLLHEGLGLAHEWTPLVPDLVSATGWGAVAYSRQGYGASSPVSPPRPLDDFEREAREVLPEVLGGLGVTRCVLIGHSDGATIAALAPASGDRRILGAVLFAPHVIVEEVALAGIASARRAFEAGSLRRALERRHADAHGAFRGWCDAWLDPARRDWGIVSDLRRITCPVVILQGDADPYGSSRQAELISRESGGPVHVSILPSVGHFPHRERADLAIAAVAGLVGGLQV